MFKRFREWRRLAAFTPTVVVMRHATTDGGDGAFDDPGLGNKGREQALAAAGVIKNHFGDKPYTFVVYTSNTARAFETGRCVAHTLSAAAIAPVDWLNADWPLSEDKDTWRLLRSKPRDQVAILVTHDPQVRQLAPGNRVRDYAQPIFLPR